MFTSVKTGDARNETGEDFEKAQRSVYVSVYVLEKQSHVQETVRIPATCRKNSGDSREPTPDEGATSKSHRRLVFGV